VAQLARSLSTLLAGGTPLVEAMHTAQESVTNRAYGMRLARAMRQVVEGGSLTQALKAENLMPDTALKMVEVGEASGKLDGMLAEVAQFYEETLDHRLARVMALIEPLLMLLMGILVGGTIVAMYLPIFNMAEVIK
jgi:type IV pilus assembly protein PilC